jgi:hypothetical protein
MCNCKGNSKLFIALKKILQVNACEKERKEIGFTELKGNK